MAPRPCREEAPDGRQPPRPGRGDRGGVPGPGRPAAVRGAGLGPRRPHRAALAADRQAGAGVLAAGAARARTPVRVARAGRPARATRTRSEEHTSELQSRPHLVCRLLLEKKKNKTVLAPLRTAR